MTERTLGNGRYVLSEPPLGVGGMGTVWKAFDTVLHREVAVKELRIPDGLNPEEQDKLRLRALREARAAAGLDHPAIVTIHDVVDEGGRPWIVMRLLPGRTLDHVVRANGPLSPRRAAELGVRLVEALSAAHANGVLHRDVKPQNVMLGADDRWMLTDFGIASVAGATRTLTGTGIVTGTLGYVAPERLSGSEPGAPADLWALGATLYHAVEGRHAYDFDDLPAMIAAVLTRDPEPMRLAGPLAPVIAGLMERDPTRRLTPAAAREQLLAIAGGYPTFENPTRPSTDRTEKIPTGTKRYGDDTKVQPPETRLTEPPADSYRVLRTLDAQLVTLNAVIGAVLALIVYSLIDGMPVWVAVALAVAITVGVVLGTWLARPLERWLGPRAALVGSALLMGESLAATGLLGAPERPILATALCATALVSYAVWRKLSGALRRRLVPEGSGRTTTMHRAAGFGAVVLGVVVAAAYLWLAETRHFDGDYLVVLLVGTGVIVMAAALLAIPALRSAPVARGRRWVPLGTSVAALVLPVFVGVQATVQYVDGLDDFSTTPAICASPILSQQRVAKYMDNPPPADKTSDSDYVSCSWERYFDGDRLDISLEKYDNSRAADRRIQSSRRSAEEDGETVAGLGLGDRSFRQSFDSSIGSEDTEGISVLVRVDNLVLETELEHTGNRPDPATVEQLATELTQELQLQHPQR